MRKMFWMKRSLMTVAVLALALITMYAVFVLPVPSATASADGSADTAAAEVTIGGETRQYNSLREAFDSVGENDTASIVLLQNITEELRIGDNVTNQDGMC